MDTTTPTASRRPHRKSRKGCQQCKQRRIKCDEGKPSCGKCLHYQTNCSFLQTQPLRQSGPYQTNASSPSTQLHSGSASSPSPLPQHVVPLTYDFPLAFRGVSPLGHFNSLDMELLHFWTTTTCLTLDPVDVYRVTIPEMAFSDNFLLHEILAVAALHLAVTRPDKASIYMNASDKHHQIALKFFQSISDINQQNCHSIMACASLLTVYSLAARSGSLILFMVNCNSVADEKSVEVVRLVRGQIMLLHTAQGWLFDGPLWPLFKPWEQRNPDTEIILPEDEEHLRSMIPLWNPLPLGMNPETASVLQASLEALCLVFSIATSDNGVGHIGATLSWYSFIPEPYVQLVQGGNPESLVLLAHYCVLLNRINGLWWVQGKPKQLLETIRDALGQDWHQWIVWPLQEVGNGSRPVGSTESGES